MDDDEIIQYRELAAVGALALTVAAMAVGFFTQLAVAVLPLAGAGIALGFWAAARGERAVTATIAIVIGLAAIGASVVWILSVD